MNNIVAEEYKIGNCVKAQFSCGVIANIIITGIAADKLGGACLEYKAMDKKLDVLLNHAIVEKVEKIELTDSKVSKFMAENGFGSKSDSVDYNGTLGIEHLKPNEKCGYKEWWSVYYRRNNLLCVVRGLKYLHEMQQVFIDAGKYELAKKLALYFR